VLAVYMPDASETPPHRLLRALSAETRWAERLGAIKVPAPVASLEAYHDWLTPHCAEVEVWRTTYLHVLAGEEALMRWMLAGPLRPYITALGERSVDFLQAYRDRLDAACPPRADGTAPFALPLTFILARR
jgi:trans-aconitate 2-methyltransferase